jgi:hypothetical protein
MASLRARLLSWPVVLAIAAALVTAELVLPRLGDDSGEVTAADRSFMKVCRDHGGTPKLASGSGDYVKDGRFCEIVYGGDTYEMYAVHPEGFSEREAAESHRSCIAQAEQERRQPEDGPGAAPRRFTWHPRSAICEKSPPAE